MGVVLNMGCKYYRDLGGNMSKTKKRGSIKTELIILFSVLVLALSISLGVIAIKVSSNILINEANSSILSLSQDAAKLEKSRLDIQRRILSTLAMLDSIQSMDWRLQQPILENALEESTFIDIGIMKLDGTINFSDGDSIKLSESDPIRKALDGDGNAINFGVNPNTKELVLMQAVPIEDNSKVVGALVGFRDGNALSNMAADTGFGKEGYGYIINHDGVIIGHPDKEMVMNMVSPIEKAKTDSSFEGIGRAFEHILEKKQGTDIYKTSDGTFYLGYAPIESTDWTFIITANKSEVLSELSTLTSTILIISVIALIISIVITYVIGNYITKPIIKTVEHGMRIADLDLVENIDDKYIKMNNEIGILARALQRIINNIRDIILDINNSSEQMAASSEELTATSQQTAAAAQEVAKTVEEIAQGVSEQAKNTEAGSAKAILLGKTIEKVQEYIDNVNASSDKVTEVVKEGLTEIDSLSKITKESTDAVERIYKVIMQTNESSNKIGEVSTLIESIAQQTNLLSLNAAIEAARAGDAGKGFAVVAEEIRNLAEQSSSSTKIINEIVAELQNNTSNAVENMKRVISISSEQSQSVNNSKDKYELIATSTKNSIADVKQLRESEDEMDEMRKEILEALENLSAIAEENAAASQQASASTEEQTASVEEIAGSSDNLSELATKLHTLVEKFKI